MLRTLGVVDISTDSVSAGYGRETLANRRFAGKPLLEWVVRRMTDALLLEEVVVLAEDTDLADTVYASVPADVSIFAPEQQIDSLNRLAEAARVYRADAIVCVSVETPFVDPALLDRLIARAESYQHCDYVSYCSARGQSPMLARLGVHGEWFRDKAVFEANRLAMDDRDRKDLSRFVRAHPEWFYLRLMPLPEALDRDDLRLAITDEEDWEHAEMILDALGPENLEWQRIASLLDGHPEIRGRMEQLNQAESIRPR